MSIKFMNFFIIIFNKIKIKRIDLSKKYNNILYF